MGKIFALKNLLWITLFSLLAVSKADGGVITLRVKMTLSVAGDRVSVKADATNTGTDPVRKVQAVLHIFDRSFTSETLERIDVKQSRSFSFDVSIPEGKQGRFPFVGEIFFHDSNLNTLSALSAGLFQLKSRYPPGLTGRATPLTLSREGTLRVQIANPLPRPQICKATLYLPHALAASDRQKQIPLEAHKETAIEFQVKNRYGYGGANYPIFCVLEYEENSHHNAVLVRAAVRIKEPINWFVRTRWYWLGGLAVILMGWGGICLSRVIRVRK